MSGSRNRCSARPAHGGCRARRKDALEVGTPFRARRAELHHRGEEARRITIRARRRRRPPAPACPSLSSTPQAPRSTTRGCIQRRVTQVRRRARATTSASLPRLRAADRTRSKYAAEPLGSGLLMRRRRFGAPSHSRGRRGPRGCRRADRTCVNDISGCAASLPLRLQPAIPTPPQRAAARPSGPAPRRSARFADAYRSSESGARRVRTEFRVVRITTDVRHRDV